MSKEKRIIAYMTNDWHLKPGNEERVLEAVEYLIQTARKNKVKKVFGLGDLFDSRSFQRLKVLVTFGKILDMFHEAEIEFIVFPGNHDKSKYDRLESFIESFKHYPALSYYDEPKRLELEGLEIQLLPFMAESLQAKMIEEASSADLMLGHFEMNGSMNLGRVSEGKKITRSMLKKFKKTYLGHFHNHHEITKDIVHLPSLMQNNFGESPDKGFTALYDDLSYEVVIGRHRRFNVVKIDLNKISKEELEQLCLTYKHSKDSIRFLFTGSDSKLKALKKAKFTNLGIDVKLQYEKLTGLTGSDAPKLVSVHTADSIKEDFKTFCEEKSYDYAVGKKLLNEFLNSKLN